MVTHDLPQGPGPSPEQRELDRHWSRIGDLRERVVEAERELAVYARNLAAFEHDYLLRCGRRYAELDSLEAELLELEAARAPDDEAKAQEAEAARAKARQTIQDSRARERSGPSGTVRETPELKATYRRAARMFHPDLGRDDGERSARHDYMVELNAAYAQGDAERIEHLMDRWQADRGPIPDRSIGDQLVDAIRIGANLEKRLVAIAREQADLEMSEVGRLHRDVQDALGRGEDLIAGLLDRLDYDIARVRARVEALRDA